MEIKKILNCVDHTMLSQTATKEDIVKLCKDAMEFKTASVCVPPYYVKLAKEELTKSNVQVCTVVGFPNGYSTKDVKVFESAIALRDGADEIDMVINQNALKNKEFDYIMNEIKCIEELCHENNRANVLKVIIETCNLNKDEIIKMCEICMKTGVDYIKTSTGFASGGAKIEDIVIIKNEIGDSYLKIKASGGIHTLEEASLLIDAGASRIGASRLIQEAKLSLFLGENNIE